AHRLARSRHRRLDPRSSRPLPQATRRHDPARLAQHGRGRAPVRSRHHHAARHDRRRRHGAGAPRTLRPRYARGGLPRCRARPRGAGGGAMTRSQTFARIGAMVLRYSYLLRASWPRLLDLVYWPAVQLMMWGFLQLYIAQNAGFFARAGGTFIGSVLLWDILFRGQLGFSISFLEEMYAR